MCSGCGAKVSVMGDSGMKVWGYSKLRHMCDIWNNKAPFSQKIDFCSTNGIIAAFLALLWIYAMFLMAS